MTQGEAVFQAVSQVFNVENGPVPETGKWTAEQSKQVFALVFSLFKNGSTVHKSNPDDGALLKYIPGLVNNWVRKDERMNGGIKYQAKRPGSRTGSGDESLKNMKLLLSVTEEPARKALIQAAIDERISALRPKVEINRDALPESLRHLVA